MEDATRFNVLDGDGHMLCPVCGFAGFAYGPLMMRVATRKNDLSLFPLAHGLVEQDIVLGNEAQNGRHRIQS